MLLRIDTLHGVSEKKWDTREEATSNSEEIKPVALTKVELRLAEGISQSVSRKLNTKFLNLHRSLLEEFRVCLKTFLGLAMSNQYCQAVMEVK